jgi:hypothetical protein
MSGGPPRTTPERVYTFYAVAIARAIHVMTSAPATVTTGVGGAEWQAAAGRCDVDHS